MRMQDSYISASGTLNQSYRSQSPQFRSFKQRSSFFNDPMNGSRSTVLRREIDIQKRHIREYIEQIQEKCTFIPLKEFQDVRSGQVAVSMVYFYNDKFKSSGENEAKDVFHNRVEEIYQNVTKKYPFIKVIRQQITDTDAYEKYPNHHLQIQLYMLDGGNQLFQSHNSISQILTSPLKDVSPTQVVLYSKQVKPELPSAKMVCAGVWLFLKKFSLTITVDCANKDIVPICEGVDQKAQEGLKVTVRQKEMSEQLQRSLTPSRQIVIRTSSCTGIKLSERASQSILFRSNEKVELDKSVRVFFSPLKQSQVNNNTLTQSIISQSDGKTLSASKSLHQNASSTKFPVKLFSQTQTTNYLVQTRFYDLVAQVGQYEIEVSGEGVRPQKTLLVVGDVLDRTQQGEQNVIVSTRIERSDVMKVGVRVLADLQPAKDALVRVTREKDLFENSSTVVDYDEEKQMFYFWGRVNQEYFVEIAKKDCFSQRRDLCLKGGQDTILEIDMVSCVETLLVFRAFNILEGCGNGIIGSGNSPIEQVDLDIVQTDWDEQTYLFQSQPERLQGITDKSGSYQCRGLMFKQLRVHARRKGFLTVSYDFDVRANSTGQTLLIPMIPDYYSLINQFHILVYIPNKSDFQLDFSLQCPDGSTLAIGSKTHPYMKAGLEITKLGRQSQLLNFAVHVQCLDPFVKSNQFHFWVANQKPTRQLLCQQGSPEKKQQQPLKENPTLSKMSSAKVFSRKSTVNVLQQSIAANISLTRSVTNINETFLKSRMQQTEIKSPEKKEQGLIAQKIVHYTSEQSVRIFVTFGHQVVETMMIQSNLVLQNEKCFGIIDLDTRRFIKDEDCGQVDFKRGLKKMPTFKQNPLLSSIDGGPKALTEILSHITNQKLRT